MHYVKHFGLVGRVQVFSILISTGLQQKAGTSNFASLPTWPSTIPYNFLTRNFFGFTSLTIWTKVCLATSKRYHASMAKKFVGKNIQDALDSMSQMIANGDSMKWNWLSTRRATVLSMRYWGADNSKLLQGTKLAMQINSNHSKASWQSSLLASFWPLWQENSQKISLTK